LLVKVFFDTKSMHLLSQVAWSAVALAYIGTVGGAADVVEIDLVFPRMNETNAPTDRLPVVFAVQNAEFAQNLRLFIAYMIRNGTNFTVIKRWRHDLGEANLSSHEPYFAYKAHTMEADRGGGLGSCSGLLTG
jgi:hypothetical protein